MGISRRIVIAFLRSACLSVAFSALLPGAAFAQDTDDAPLIYGKSGNDTPDRRTWDDSASSWISAAATSSCNTAIRWIVTKVRPQSTEQLSAVLSDSGSIDLDMMRWNGSTWAVDWTVATSMDASMRGFDLEYEGNSGEGLVVYSDNDTNPAFRTFTGGSWSAPAAVFASTPASGTIRWVELVRRPNSDNILLVMADANSDLFAIEWTGSSWDETNTEVTLSTSISILSTKCFDAAYENGGDILVAWGEGTTDGITYATKAPAASWAAAATTTYANDNTPECLDLAAEPFADRIACVHNTGSDGGDAEAAVWNGSSWVNGASLDGSVDTPGAGDMGVAVGWVGTSGTAVAVYRDTDAGTQIDWDSWTSGGGWASQPDFTITGFGEIESVQIESFLNSSKLMMVVADTNSDVYALTNNGSNWTATNSANALETNLSVITSVPFGFDVAPCPVTLANHDAGQESDAFLEAGAQTNAELFAFKLSPNHGTVSITQLVFTLSSIYGLVDGDWAGIEIVVDSNNDGSIGGGETTTVGGAGVVSTSAGTITFSTSISVSAATNYILRADFSSLSGGDDVTISLPIANFTGVRARGSATSVRHIEGMPVLDNDDIRLLYSTTTSPADTPRARTWDDSGTNWLAAQQTASSNSTLRWIVSKVNPIASNDEIAVALSDTGSGSDLDAIRFNGSTWTVDWSSTSITQANTAYRGFDVEYERSSGEILVVYSNNTTNPQYRTRSGGAWSSPANVFSSVPGTGTVLWVELVRRPSSNEILLVYADSNNDLFGIVWNGASWDEASTEVTFETSLNMIATQCFHAAYENTTGDILVAWGRNTVDGITYSTKTPTGSWASTATYTYTNDFEPEALDLATEPAGNRIACVHASGADGSSVEAATWDGSSWVNGANVDSLVDNPGAGDLNCSVGWVGISGTAVLVYRDNDAGAEIDWATWTSGGGWSTQGDTGVTGLGEIESCQIESFSTQNKLMLVLLDSNSDLYAMTYNGTSWTVTNSGSALETGVSAINSVPFSFDLSPLHLRLLDHANGQEVDAFLELGAQTDAELFGFRLSSHEGSTNVTSLVFSLSSIVGLVDGDWAGVEIRVDTNGDGAIGGGETTTVGGTGTVSTAAGTITFSTLFTVSGTTNYILRADFASLSSQDQVTIALTSSNVTASRVSGTTTSVRHVEGIPGLDKGDVRLIYATTTSPADTPRVRAYDDSASFWSTAQQSTAANTTIRWIVHKISPTKIEEMALVLSDTGAGSDLDLLRYANSAWSVDWSSTAITSANAAKQGFDLALEASSDDALAVYSNNTSNPQYRTRVPGASWSAPASVFASAPGSGTVEWVTLVSRPSSNNILLVYSDSNADLFAIEWTGSGWDEAGTEVTLETTLNVIDKRCFDAAYENGGDVLVAWGRDTVDGITYATKPAGGSWAAVTTFTYDGGNDDEPEVLDLAPEPGGNRIACGHLTGADGGDLEVAVWDGTGWVNGLESDGSTDAPGAGDMTVAAGWVGTSGTAVVVYRDTDAGGEIDWRSWTSGGGWSNGTDSAISGMSEIESAQIEMFPGQNKFMLVLSDSNSDVYAATYNGTTWTATNSGTALETGLSSIASRPFSHAMKERFVFTGTVRQTNESTALTGVSMDISLLLDGVASQTVAVNTSDGTYSFVISTATAGAEVTVFIDNHANDGVTVSETTGVADLSSLDIIQDRLVVRSDGGGSTTNAELDTANNADADITAIYSDGGVSSLTVASGKVLYVSGSFAPGGQVNIPASNTMKVVSGGTLTLASIIQFGNAASFTINSGATFAGTSGAELRTITPGTDRFTCLINGTTNVTSLVFRSGETNGLDIQNGAGITALRNVSFYNIKSASGSKHLTIAATTLNLECPGCYFDTLAADTYNVGATDSGGSSDVILHFEDRDVTANGPGRGEANDNDQDTNANGIINGAETSPGSVVLWWYRIQRELSGTLQGWPAAAFDFTDFSHYSTYVVERDIYGTDTDDRITALDSTGAVRSYSYTVANANGNILGPVYWYTEGGTHTLYFGTTAGYLYKLTDTGGGFTLASGFPINGSASATPMVEVTSPVIIDGTNIYCGGRENGTPTYRVYAYAISSQAQVFARSVGSKLQTFPMLDTSTGTTYVYLGADHDGSNGHIHRFDVAAAVNDRDNTTPTDHVRASLAMTTYEIKLHVGDYDGRMHGIQPTSSGFTNETGWPIITSPHVAINQTEIQTAAFVQLGTNKVYWGDSDGHFVVYSRSGVLQTNFAIQPDGTNAIVGAPSVDAGVIYFGNNAGKFFVIDESTGNTHRTYTFPSGTTISEINYQWTNNTYQLATSTGKVYYLAAVSDPTP